MAKDPQDRDEAKRSDPPSGAGGMPAGGAGRLDAHRATNDDPKAPSEENFLLDVGEEAPRVQPAASEDDASEEWILVDDDLIAAANEADGAGVPMAGAKAKAPEPKREDDAAQRIEEMKELGGDLAPVAPFDEDGSSAARAAAAAQEESDAVAPMDFGAAEVPPAGAPGGPAEEPSLAPVLDLPAPEPEQEARPRRRSLARVAGIAVAASLVAGGWFAFQSYRARMQPTTEVATKPAGVEKPVVAPNPVPVAKPQPKKPESETAKPADPVAKNPTPPAPAPTPLPAKGETIPVIPVNAPTDPATTAVAPAPKPASADPNATPGGPKGMPTPVVNSQLPIRPARPLDPKAAKAAAGAKRADTIVELKNGYTLRGRLKRVKDDQITLGVQGGEYTFALPDVKVLDSSAPEYMAEADMPPVSIVLKSGQRMRGKLLKQSADHVVLVVEAGQIVIDRSEIREVSFTGRIHF
jgi:cytoskeletal protein RodZ